MNNGPGSKPESDEAIAAHIARKKIASANLKKANRLLAAFDSDARVNRRIAVIGLLAFMALVAVIALSDYWFDSAAQPDAVVLGKLLELKRGVDADDPNGSVHRALVELESGQKVWATIDWKIADLFKPGFIVEVACFDVDGETRHEVIIGKMPKSMEPAQ